MSTIDSTLETRLAISDLMTGWMHRDLGEWEELLALFHPDAAIEITWFEGKFSDFVDGSRQMGHSALKTKHFMAAPLTSVHGDRAIAETNATIIADNPSLNLGCVAHNRFYDRIERRNGQWKVLKRLSIYDGGYFTFTPSIAEIDQAEFQKYPREYASLAYLLSKSGFPVKRLLATKGSGLEKDIKQEARRWLAG